MKKVCKNSHGPNNNACPLLV
uniref:Uncharacterized protein n=1 Tax=Rhizophora mucronata TaxID=61149 RepID=A0A2P2PWM2_RHIMU